MLAVDFALHNFQMSTDSDHGNKVEINYDLTGSTKSKLDVSIRLYNSVTGATLQTITDDISTGTNKRFEFQPAYLDLQIEDYQLMFDLTIVQSGVTEPDTTNNDGQFAGGMFMSKPVLAGVTYRQVQIFGNDTAETYTLGVLETSGTDTVRLVANGVIYDYPATGNPMFVARLQGGDDTFTTVSYVGVKLEQYSIGLLGGAGNDTFDMTWQNWSMSLRGNDGDDTFIIGSGAGGFYGGNGSDTLKFVSNTNTVNTNNYLIVNTPTETGVDTLDFSALTTAVTLNLSLLEQSQMATTGNQGLKIWLRDVSTENLIGSNYNDTLTGNSSVNVIEGRGGNDTINGGDGNDTLKGGDGVDTIHGNDGDDTIWGELGADFLYGDAGVDTFDSDVTDTVVQ